MISFIRMIINPSKYHEKMILKRIAFIRAIKVILLKSTGQERCSSFLASHGLPIPLELKEVLHTQEITELMEINGIFVIDNKTDNESDWKVYRPKLVEVEVDMKQSAVMELIGMRAYEHRSRGKKELSMVRIINPKQKI